MKKILNALDARSVSSVLIAKENDKYHELNRDSTPRRRCRNVDHLQVAADYDLYVDRHMTKPETWALFEDYIQKHAIPTVCDIARSTGHELINSPPHYLHLQRIESVWALIKSTIGRAYLSDKKFPDVLARFRKMFVKLQPGTVMSCINKANRKFAVLEEIIEKKNSVKLL